MDIMNSKKLVVRIKTWTMLSALSMTLLTGCTFSFWDGSMTNYRQPSPSKERASVVLVSDLGLNMFMNMPRFYVIKNDKNYLLYKKENKKQEMSLPEGFFFDDRTLLKQVYLPALTPVQIEAEQLPSMTRLNEGCRSEILLNLEPNAHYVLAFDKQFLAQSEGCKLTLYKLIDEKGIWTSYRVDKG